MLNFSSLPGSCQHSMHGDLAACSALLLIRLLSWQRAPFHGMADLQTGPQREVPAAQLMESCSPIALANQLLGLSTKV